MLRPNDIAETKEKKTYLCLTISFEIIDLLWFLFKNFPKIHTHMHTNKILHKIKYKYNSTDNISLSLSPSCSLHELQIHCFCSHFDGKNTVCKHLHTVCYCLRMADRCSWWCCVYLSMKLIPINNKLYGVCADWQRNSHTQMYTREESAR